MDSERKRQLDEALLEALLVEVYHSKRTEDDARVTKVLSRLGEDTGTILVHRSEQRRWRPWLTLAVAACVLIAVPYLFSLATSNQAYAAVDRCLASATSVRPAIRQYRMHMVHQRPIWGNTQVTAELYFDEEGQFAFHHPSWMRKGSLWIGGGPKERWVVPVFGPAFTGSSDVVTNWLYKKDIPGHYFHIVTILQRLRHAYRLSNMGNEVILSQSDGSTVNCRHVVGTSRRMQPGLPRDIELWANMESGIAEKIVLRWDRAPGERGPVSWTIDFVGTPDVASDWFRVEGHVDPARRIVRLESEEQLDEPEN